MAFCQNCGRQLPAGVQVCPNCGTSTAYNTGGSGVAPAGSTLSSAEDENAPTVYSSPPPPPDYGTPPPPVSTNYGPPPYSPFGAPQSGEYSAPTQPGGYGMPQQPPKKRSRVGLIVGIVIGVVVLLCAGTFLALYEVGKNSLDANATATASTQTQTANNNPTATPTSTPTTAPTSTPTTSSGSSPSGNPIDPTAASIITNPVMASAVDSNDQPTNVTSTFQVNQKIWVTFGLNLQGSTGYVEAKWYVNDQLYVTRSFAANNLAYTSGYFWQEYTSPGQGTVELYWCTQSNCSDAALATFTTFTVTNTGYHSGSQTPFVFATDVWRRD